MPALYFYLIFGFVLVALIVLVIWFFLKRKKERAAAAASAETADPGGEPIGVHQRMRRFDPMPR